jgi:hypothetical protein
VGRARRQELRPLALRFLAEPGPQIRASSLGTGASLCEHTESRGSETVPRPRSSVSEQNKQVVRRVLDELFDKGDLDATDQLIHPDFVNHEAPPDNPHGGPKA